MPGDFPGGASAHQGRQGDEGGRRSRAGNQSMKRVHRGTAGEDVAGKSARSFRTCCWKQCILAKILETWGSVGTLLGIRFGIACDR